MDQKAFGGLQLQSRQREVRTDRNTKASPFSTICNEPASHRSCGDVHPVNARNDPVGTDREVMAGGTQSGAL